MLVFLILLFSKTAPIYLPLNAGNTPEASFLVKSLIWASYIIESVAAFSKGLLSLLHPVGLVISISITIDFSPFMETAFAYGSTDSYVLPLFLTK